MGRSALAGVSDGEWAVFAEKVVRERDDAIERVGELERLLDEARNFIQVAMTKGYEPITSLRLVDSITEMLGEVGEPPVVWECLSCGEKSHNAVYPRGCFGDQPCLNLRRHGGEG